MRIIYYSGMKHCNLKAIYLLICQENEENTSVYKMIANNRTRVNYRNFLPKVSFGAYPSGWAGPGKF